MLALLALAAAGPFQGAPTAVTYPGSVLFPAFGNAVALDGDTLVVGAREAKPCCNQQGEAFIFTRNGADWDHALTLTSPGTDRFGWEVAVDGDVAAAADFPDNNTKVLIAERTGANWALAQTVTYAGMPVITAEFGRSLAMIDGRLIVSAARGRQGTNLETGVVYVYEKVAGTWTVVQSILPPPNANGQVPTRTRFGARVAVDGDLLAITASNAPDGGSISRGSLHVFRWDPTALPVARYAFEATIEAPMLSNQVWFGLDSLDVSHGRIATASTLAHDQGVVQAGIAHVFEKVGGGWQESARLHDPRPSINGGFGRRLAISGDRLLIGRGSFLRTMVYDLPLTVEVFEESAGAWSHVGAIADPIPGGNTGFGEALDLQGNELVAGFDGAHVEREDRGACYVGNVAFGWEPVGSLVCGGNECVCPGRSFEGCGNGQQVSASITAFGSTSVAADDLLLTATGMEPGAFARLLLGRAMAVPSPFGDGQLCIHAPARLMPLAVDFTGAVNFGEGLVARAAQQLGPNGTIITGETWIFQAMYTERKARFGCSTNGYQAGAGILIGRPYLAARGFNLTNALQVTFAP